MVGKSSLWPIWRAALPQGTQLTSAVLAKLKTWASSLDPDPAHTERVAGLALELYDGLLANGLGILKNENSRTLLQAAAFMHEVGRAKTDKGHHKVSARLINQLDAPLGWGPEDLHVTALIARYHRGALPKPKALASLSAKGQQLTRELAGIFRLADALDASHDGRIQRIRVNHGPGAVTLYADGYSADSPLVEKIAAARHLLESTLGLPVFVRGTEA